MASLLQVAGLGPRQGPMSVEEITSEADDMLKAYNPNIPLKMFLRSADAINKQGQSYDADSNEEEAFKFYYRHALLIMSKLSKHPEVQVLNRIFKQPGARPTLEQQQLMLAWRRSKQDVTSNLERMEALKPNIKRRYEAFQFALARREEENRSSQQDQRNHAYSALVGDMGNMSIASGRSSVLTYGGTQELDPEFSSDLAVKLAHNEFRGAGLRGTSSKASRQKRISHRGTFFSDDDSEEDISQQIRAVGQRREQALAKPVVEHHRTDSINRAPQYPSVPKRNLTNDSWYGNSPDSTPSLSQARLDVDAPAPLRPPKEHLFDSTTPPLIPTKQRSPSPVEAPDTGVLDPRKYTFITSASTEDGRPLRTLFINPKVRTRFLTIALANTQRNLETCGILCGKLMSNAFFVSKLVIPEQESTSDTCDTVNEGALFDYCDNENLMTLGWIHTHPTQTCFMSSRDLHTHSGYQVQLSESIAIVCAPRHEPSWGVFRLTDPPGLHAVLNCKQTGIFHPHQEQNIYTDALMPGHVKELDNLPFDVVDLRPDSTWI